MSFEGHYQIICSGEFPHFFEQPCCYGEEEGKKEFWACEECGASPAWVNTVDDTNCDAYGHVEIELRPDGKVLKWPSPFKGTWYKKPGERFWVICENHHLYTGVPKVKREKACTPVFNMDFRCPKCKGQPIWTKERRPDDAKLRCRGFHDLPSLTDGTWAYVEGGQKILVSDLLRLIRLKLLAHWFVSIEDEVKKTPELTIDQLVVRKGWAIELVGSLSLEHDLPEICFSKDRSYPYDWFMSVEAAESILAANKKKQKRVLGL